MQSIATLVNDDPYLKMPREERIALRRRRRELFKPVYAEPAEQPRPLFVVLAEPAAEPIKPPALDPVMAWIERQKAIPLAPLIPIEPSSVRPPKILTVDIQRAVASHYQIALRTLFSATRRAKVVLPRQIAYYLMRVMTGLSLPDIGRRFGYRDHTTILHAVRKIERMMEADLVFKAEVQSLRARIEEHFS